MPNMTLKNLPPGLHARLKAAAERNRRSLNSEILARLEGVTRPTADREAYSRDLRAFTANLPKVSDRLVARFKIQGRR
jgi:plasmid stability protein